MRKKINLAGVLAVAGTILFFSVFKPPTTGSAGGGFSSLHLLAYMGLAFSLCLYFKDTERNFLDAFIVAALFGVSTEILQYFIPGRYFGLTDIAANTLGASIVLLESRLGAFNHLVLFEGKALEKLQSSYAEHF